MVALVEDAMGARATKWHKPHTGLTPAQRFVVDFEGGDSAFVKAAVDGETETMLRTEHRMVATVDADLVPATRAWIENGVESVLITEDLRRAYWPADHTRDDGHAVRWEPRQIELLLDALPRVAAHDGGELPAVDAQPGWRAIAADPTAFLALGVCTPAWLDASIDALIELEDALDLRGEGLVHNDVRSDNVCFLGDRVVLVDWSVPRRGPGWFDRACLATTLPLEAGVDPMAIAPDAQPFAAWAATELARNATVHAAPPWLIEVWKRMIRITLDWALA